MHCLNSDLALMIQTHEVLGLERCRSHIEHHIVLVVLVIAVDKSIVDQAVRISLCAVEKHNLLACFDSSACMAYHHEVRIIFMINLGCPL